MVLDLYHQRQVAFGQCASRTFRPFHQNKATIAQIIIDTYIF